MTPESRRASSRFIWSSIRKYVEKQKLVPVIGPGVVTFGPDDTPLYPWLLGEMAKEFGLEVAPRSFNSLVCEIRKTQGPRGEREVRSVMEERLRAMRSAEPSPLLRELASLPNCDTYLTLGCDPLLEEALARARGRAPEKWNSFECKGSDLPSASGGRCVLGYLFGEVSAEAGSFNLWDADAIEFAFSLQAQRSNSACFPHLIDTLTDKHLLFIGASMSDWALRFLLRIIKNAKLGADTEQELFLTERDDGRSDDPVAFFNVVGSRIHFQHEDPIEFARELCRTLGSLPPSVVASNGPAAVSQTAAPPEPFAFISYAHEDKEAAKRIAESLRQNQVKVWIDEQELAVGQGLSKELATAIERCAVFISVISSSSESRETTVAREERRLAFTRAKRSSPDFYLPVVIHTGLSKPFRGEPKAFHDRNGILEHDAIVMTALDGRVDDRFLNRVSSLIQARRRP